MSRPSLVSVLLRAVAAVVIAASGLELSALRSAGLTGSAPNGSGVITHLVATLTSNWEWLIGTGVGLVLMLIAGMMMFGSQRAPDHLFRVIAGIMLILVVIPAVLA
jgi:integral membrane sensor domain MASE1